MAFLTSCGDGVLPAGDLRAGEKDGLIAAHGGNG